MADRRAARHAATRQEIVEAAWANLRARGVADLSLKEVAEAVGMRPPSLYVYFADKLEVYDAMFGQGAAALTERMRDLPARAGTAREALLDKACDFFDFCTEDPTRYQLLFERVVPGFEPSAESYAKAVEALELTRSQLAELGAAGDAALDLWTALMSGLTSQQIANDPGGTRWRELLPAAVDMYADHVGIPAA